MSNTLNFRQLQALKLIDRFNPKCLDGKVAFSAITKEEFLNSIRDLISNPLAISQGVHPLCGIACVMKIAAELDPVNLVKMGGYFYANGEYITRSFLTPPIKVPSHLKNMKAAAGHTSANFILQSTIKSFYNPVTCYNNKPGTKFNEWQGITFPSQLRKFLKTYFDIDSVPMRTYRHTIEEIQSKLKEGITLMAWTSWNQMKKHGGRFKLLQQHYVIIKNIERFGTEIHLTIDNPRKTHDKLQVIKFENEKQCYKALIGVYGFKRKEKVVS